jgi:transcriptional regulator with XRE-family HTH domain
MPTPEDNVKSKPSKSPLAQFVSQRRRELGMNQESLAKAASLTLDRVKSIETGRSKPNKMGLLKMLANALAVPIEDMLSAAGLEVPDTGNKSLEEWEEPEKQRPPLADFMVKRREELGLNQVELSNKTGVPSGTIASIEAGHSETPKSETLRKLAKGLLIRYEELDCVSQGIPYKPRKKQTEPLREFELYLQNHDKIPAEVAETVMDMVRAVIRRYE